MKTNIKSIKISGQSEAYVVSVGAEEIGTIARCSKKGAWSVCKGIGASAKLIGTCYAKEGAKFLLTESLNS
tara:strand:- start:11 stop:223 length:213 start_codon:yes stop_codon:yes gene_type:complete